MMLPILLLFLFAALCFYGEQKLCSLKDDALVSWRVGLRGDGSFNSANQAKSMFRDNRTISYFITVPVQNAKRSAYVMDWIIRKNTKYYIEEWTICIAIFKRGYFFESYSKKDFFEAGLDMEFVQDNQSFSTKGVLRGLHFQTNHPQDKLVYVISGILKE